MISKFFEDKTTVLKWVAQTRSHMVFYMISSVSVLLPLSLIAPFILRDVLTKRMACLVLYPSSASRPLSS